MNKNKTIKIFIVAFAILFAAGINSKSQADLSEQPVDLVDPLIDSANSRWFFFSSASRPFGMVNLSPDTEVRGAWGSGYRYDTEKVLCFSHIHAWQLAGIPVMPVVGDMAIKGGLKQYGSFFSHEKEEVSPGYHKIFLEDYGITAELTSTTRVGFHRYTFPESDSARIIFDLGAKLGPTDMAGALIRKTGESEIEGYVINAATRRRPKETTIYFVARLNKPFTEFSGWEGNSQVRKDEISGKDCGAYLGFKTTSGEKILMKVAISYVSIQQARLNLTTELDHEEFDQVVRDSHQDWNDWLSKIEVTGGSHNQRVRFYTDLWHALQGRRIASDVNGKYLDMTGDTPRTGQIPLGPDGKPIYNHHNSDAFWGAQWSISILWSMAYPNVMNDFVNTMVDMYKNGGLIPRGPSGGNYTFVMTGASSTPFIVAAYQKGIRNFDVETAYEGMRKNHFPGGLMSKAGYEHNSEKGGGIEYYIERGYVPERFVPINALHVKGAGQTLEYSYQDWCLAQMAKSLEKNEDYELFMKRSENYKNLFDKKYNLMRPRTLLGNGIWPFRLESSKGFVEANALHDRWFVPHDIPGLIKLMGGREAFTEILKTTFENAEKHDFVSTGPGYNKGLNYSNQPAMHPAHLFNYSGTPWLSQKYVRKVKEQAFGGTTPHEGYRGDEDQGLMGSLSVLMAIGLFDVQGGAAQNPHYEITSPIFDKVVIHLDQNYYTGEKFVIDTKNNSKENVYIQSANFNGEPLTKPWISHSDFAAGGKISLELGPKPNKQWGSAPEDAPGFK